MNEYKHNLSMRFWAEDDKPREKLLQKGRASLSDAELLSLLFRSGSNQCSAVDLSKKVLNKASNDLNILAKMTAHDLTKIPGIGIAKATSLLATWELNRRRSAISLPAKFRIQSSADAFRLMKASFFDLEVEEFWIIVMSRSNDVLHRCRISQGGVSGTVADNKVIFKYVLEYLASSLIVLHNHPSGNLKPSNADEKLTKKIKSACENLDVQLLDHLIIHNDRFFSLADEGLL
ncbi:MAG: DNA repair protein RadC [Vicingaceae bacterium]